MTEIKRPNYFTSEFLVEDDFIDEQTYHRDMRYRHNELLHTWGVVDGLNVSKTADKQVTISPGMAINKDGKEIILPSDQSPQTLNISGTGDILYVTIEYQDVKDEADKDTTSGVINQYRRITERPLIKSTTSQPSDGAVILLAKVKLDNNGSIEGKPDTSVRTFASSKIADDAISIQKLKKAEIKVGSMDLEPGGSKSTEVFRAPLDSSRMSCPFLLVYAHSKTPKARFTWNQEYLTEGDPPDLYMTQIVKFKNLELNPIKVEFKIYSVFES